jgi:integral membrane protein
MLSYDTPPARLRTMACLEGLSYLVLLFVAMPLKYFAGLPSAVRIVGSIHGLLFVWLSCLIARGFFQRGKTFGWALRIGIASLIPFGTLAIDRSLREEDELFRREPA